MIPSTNSLAFQSPSALPLNSIGASHFSPRSDKWWPASENLKIPASDGTLSRRSRPTLSMALGFSAAVGGILPKQLVSGTVSPALQGLGELLPAAGAPMIAILCISAGTWLLSMLVYFVVRSFSLWWSMAVRSRRALPSSTLNSAVQIEKLKDEYQRVSAVKAQALTRINELSKNLASLESELHDDSKYARSKVACVEERVQSIKEISQKFLGDSTPTRSPIPSFTRSNIRPSQLGNAKSAEMDRIAVATVSAPPSPDTASLSGTIGDQWEVVMEAGSGGKYALLRHLQFKTSIELPLFGMGVLFAGGSDSVVRRCWADGTLYERFAFHTGTTLIDADEGQSVSRKLLSDPDGVTLGSWLVKEHDEFITVKSSKHDEELVLLRDGFAFFGGGTRGVIVQGGSEPEVERTTLLRSKIGLPEADASTQKSGRGEAARARTQDEVGQSIDDVPVELVCPLTQAVMSDPWIASDGFSYERTAIEEWFARKGARSPTTGLALPDTRLLPNNALRSIIATYVEH
mmetsp:Transcript_42665/g.100269  ORF Transcript_42665/g.100269 Transcript_42665/m.100269 type:complete len:518 (-) Transcript_42665:153-1706(-)